MENMGGFQSSPKYLLDLFKSANFIFCFICEFKDILCPQNKYKQHICTSDNNRTHDAVPDLCKLEIHFGTGCFFLFI